MKSKIHSMRKNIPVLALALLVPCFLFGAFRVPDGPPGAEASRPPVFMPVVLDVAQPLPPEEVPEAMIDRFFFVSESLEQILKFFSDLTDKRILSPENLPRTTVSFDSEGPLSKEDAIVAIESLLQMNGISIAEMGDSFIRVLPANNIRYKSPSFIQGSTLGMPASERVYTKLFKLNYLKLEEGATVVGNLLTQGVGYLEQLRASNAFLVTDTLVNLQRMEQLLSEIDLYSAKEIIFRKLDNIKASELKNKLQTLADGSMSVFIDGKISVEADDRTNQVIIAAEASNREFIEALISTYDQSSAPFTVNDVVYLKHAEAEKVVGIVNNLITEQKKSNEDEYARANITPGRTPSAVDPSLGNVGGSDASTSSDAVLQFSSFVAVEADERSNAILIYGTKSDIEAVKGLIANLDVLLPQVRIDVVITEVTLSNDNNRGIDRFGISYDEDDSIGYSINQDSDLPISFEGTLSDVILRSLTITDFTLSTVFSTAKHDSNVRVISAPTLVTTHNREAVINAGESRPVITSSNTDSTGLSTRSQVSFKDIGVQLKVKPLIGSNGMVQMEVQQTVESVVDEVTIDGNSQPVIGKREATSFVSVASGNVVVLGGLQERTTRDSEGKTGFWGSIPVVGRLLFSSDRESKTTRELIIFIKPTVFTSAEDAVASASTAIRELDESVKQNVAEILEEEIHSELSDDQGNSSDEVVSDKGLNTRYFGGSRHRTF